MIGEGERQLLQEHAERLKLFHDHLKAVKRFPHRGQHPVIRAFFNDRKKIVQMQCGRSAGKTETILYMAWRFALTNPGAEIYIICPELKQAKKIYWLKQRVQRYGPKEFVTEIRESELRVLFDNGSYIVLDGCENYEALRGIKPTLVFYDEFQHHSREFHEEVMEPNLSNIELQLVVAGTPPKTKAAYYVEFRDQLIEQIDGGDPTFLYYEMPSWSNPTVDYDWCMKQKAKLLRRGKKSVWLREYEGKLAFDQESAILPFWNPDKHKMPASRMHELLSRDRSKLQWYALFDPGTATCFAGLFMAVNPYTSQVYVVGEIYAKERTEMNSFSIWKKASAIKERWNANSRAWLNYYDEAALWFANEIQAHFGEALFPTQKQRASTQATFTEEGRPGESILNTLMDTEGLFYVSDECVNFQWEIEQYIKDDQGRFPTKNDHLMDLLFYWVTLSRYTLIGEEEEERKPAPRTLAQEFAAKRAEEEPEEDCYDYGDGVSTLWQ